MSSRIFFVLLLILSACDNKGRGQTVDRTPQRLGRQITCQPSEDPMACVRLNCVAAGASFDEAQKVCGCPSGSVLSTTGSYQCLPVHLESNAGGGAGAVLRASDGVDQYSLFIEGPDLAMTQNLLSLRNSSLAQVPLFNHGNQAFRLYRNAEEMRSLKIDPETLRQITGVAAMASFFLKPDLNLPVNANGGIRDAMRGLAYMQNMTPPSDHAVTTGRVELDAAIAQSLKSAQTVAAGEDFLNYGDNGCDDQCTGRTVLIDNSQFLVYRTRYFFSGALMQDQISIFDKSLRQTVAVLFLYGGKVANYLLLEDSEVWLHANEPGLQASRVALLFRIPPRNSVPSYRLRSLEAPVLTFELAIDSSVIDSIIPRGPFPSSHVYGWFRTEDQLPFFKNYHNLPTQYAEEEIEYSSMDSLHGAAVTSLVTDGFKHPIIPFAASDLLNANFTKFTRNYFSAHPGQVLVASLSALWSLSPTSCLNSPLGKVITSQTNSILWVMGASNSGGEFTMNSFACPQNIEAANILRVAASANGETLASSSARGERTVHIAEIGCPPEREACQDGEVGTSYAAPRLARKISDLINLYSGLTAVDVAFAVMATARVPYTYFSGLKPLPVVSGGFADIEAAGKLLAMRTQWPQDRNLVSDSWQSLLQQAKADQYSSISEWRMKKYVMAQARYFMKRGNF